MANYYPLYLDADTGSIKQTGPSHVIRALYLPTVPGDVANTYITSLPDPYYYQTQSADITDSSNSTSQSLLEFAVPSVSETAYYLFDSLVGLQTTATATGVRIGIQTVNPADSMYTGKVASTLTAFTIRHQGTADAFQFVLPASMAAINTTYPGQIKGFFRNTTTNDEFKNVLLLQSETNNIVTSKAGGFMNTSFVGFSSSIAPISSSYGSLSLSSSKIDAIGGGDLITQSVLPPTRSLWVSQSLGTAVANTSNATYATVFTLSGLEDDRRYLVQFYLIARTAATTTGFRCRAVSGSDHWGSIYIPTSATALAIQNSAGGTDISNIAPTAWPAANGDRLVYGEYLVTKTAGIDPQIQIISEIAGSAVTAGIGSVVFYRPLDASQLNQELVTPLTLYSGSLTAHSIPNGSTKGNILRLLSSQLPTFAASPIRYELQPEDAAQFTTSTTAVNITNLAITLQNSSNYLIVAYIGGSSAASTVGFRSGVSVANASVNVYSIEIPNTATAVTIGNNQASAPTASPASNIANYYMIKHTCIVRTAATGTPTWTPTIYSETGGQVSAGPSVVYYIKY